MKILVACDKFKGSLEADKVCAAIAKGLQTQNKNFIVKQQALADGGDGTLKILKDSLQLETVHCLTTDPLGRPISSYYLKDENRAFIELAISSGIALLNASELDIMRTHTSGTGKLIQHALEHGCKEIILTIGGSCSNDMGLGIAEELGYTFVNKTGQKIQACGRQLIHIDEIIKPRHPTEASFTILCDVDNPLYGPHGAAQIYGPQKGATQTQIAELDKGMRHLADLILLNWKKDISKIPGAGAAGGIAGGLFGILNNVKLKNGFDFLSDLIDLENKITEADLIITGEGQLDDQSFDGKVIGKIKDLSILHQKPLIVVCGINQLKGDSLSPDKSIDIFETMKYAKDQKDSMDNAEFYLVKIAQDIAYNIQR